MFSTPKENYKKGFSMTFDNGWTVSVQWGAGTYSSNYDAEFDDKVPCNATVVEIGIKGPKEGDDWEVDGWLSSDKIARLIFNVSQRKEG
jgi:hypothetical protein